MLWLPALTKVDLKGRTVHGAFWTISFALANKVFTLGGQWALAWFLLPADMGLASAAQAMAAFAAILSAGGLGNVLLQRGKYKQEAGQAHWVSLILTFFMSLTIASLALASPALGKGELTQLLWVLAGVALLGAPQLVWAAGLQERLAFKSL